MRHDDDDLQHVVTSAPTLAVFRNLLNLPVLSFVHSVTDTCTPFSGLAVFQRNVM